MRRDRGATEQSSGIATSGIEGETDVEGLEDGELLESRAPGRWPGDLRKSRIKVLRTRHQVWRECRCTARALRSQARAWGRTCT